MKYLEQVVDTLLAAGAHKATKYISEREVIHATRRTYKARSGKRVFPAKNQNVDLVVTIGRPNYRDREFIRKCKAAGEPFPVKKVQLRYLPQTRV